MHTTLITKTANLNERGFQIKILSRLLPTHSLLNVIYMTPIARQTSLQLDITMFWVDICCWILYFAAFYV